MIEYRVAVICDDCRDELEYELDDEIRDARDAMRDAEQLGWKVQRLVTDLTLGQAKCYPCSI